MSTVAAAPIPIEAPSVPLAAQIAAETRQSASAWWVLGLLFLIYTTWSIDRAVPSIVAEQVKKTFDLSDGQLGLFSGLVYGLSFGFGALISGPLVDYFNRARLLATLVVLWSGLTALGGLASTYVVLIATRFGVGGAEAGGEPAALSLIADLFPVRRRATAIGLFKMGTPIGLLIASTLCGYLTSYHGWRTAFLIAGVPGVFLAFAAWRWLPNPPRGQFDHPGIVRRPLTLREVFGLIGRSGVLICLLIGAILFYFANSGPTAFLVAYLQRIHGISLVAASTWYGVASAIGTAGPLLAGLLADRLVLGGVHRSIWLLTALSLLAFATGVVMVLAGEVWIVLGAMICWQIVAVSLSTPTFAALLALSPAEARGTTTALLLICMYLLGIGPGPYAAGLLSDLLGGGPNLRYALALQLGLNLVASVMFFAAASLLRTRAYPASGQKGSVA